jgi:hypothetical protein
MMQDLEMALTSGACPALQVLKIHGCVLNDDHLTCLAAAVRADAVRGLRALKIQSSPHCQNNVGIEKLMMAVEAGGCPMLTDLSLIYCHISGGAAQALARAVRAGVIPGLAGLHFDHHVESGVVAPLVEALAEGTGCPALRALNLRYAVVTEEEMLPLLMAVNEGRLGKVRSLSFGGEQLGGAGVRVLVEAMARGQEIEELSIHDGRLTEQDLLLLVGRHEHMNWAGHQLY